MNNNQQEQNQLSNMGRLTNLHVELKQLGASIDGFYLIPIMRVTVEDDFSIEEILDRMLNHISDSNIKFLNKQFKDFDLVVSSFRNTHDLDQQNFLYEFLDDLKKNSQYPILAQISLSSDIKQVFMNNDGEVIGADCDLNTCTHEWFLADGVDHAFEISKQRAIRNLINHQTILS